MLLKFIMAFACAAVLAGCDQPPPDNAPSMSQKMTLTNNPPPAVAGEVLLARPGETAPAITDPNAESSPTATAGDSPQAAGAPAPAALQAEQATSAQRAATGAGASTPGVTTAGPPPASVPQGAQQ